MKQNRLEYCLVSSEYNNDFSVKVQNGKNCIT